MSKVRCYVFFFSAGSPGWNHALRAAACSSEPLSLFLFCWLANNSMPISFGYTSTCAHWEWYNTWAAHPHSPQLCQASIANGPQRRTVGREGGEEGGGKGWQLVFFLTAYANWAATFAWPGWFGCPVVVGLVLSFSFFWECPSDGRGKCNWPLYWSTCGRNAPLSATFAYLNAYSYHPEGRQFDDSQACAALKNPAQSYHPVFP
jgi:hypothetical protein